MNVLSNYVRLSILDNSSPATIQRVNALGLSVRPIASRGPFHVVALQCAWSIDMPDDTLDELCESQSSLFRTHCILQDEHERAYSDHTKM